MSASELKISHMLWGRLLRFLGPFALMQIGFEILFVQRMIC